MPSARVRLRSDAAREITAAIEWYEADDSPSAVTFLRAFDQTIEQIANFPASGTLTGEPGVRQILVPGFLTTSSTTSEAALKSPLWLWPTPVEKAVTGAHGCDPAKGRRSGAYPRGADALIHLSDEHRC